MLYDHDEMVDSLPSKSYLNNSKLDSFELLSNQSVYQDDQEISSIVDLKEKNIDQTLTLRNISLTNTTTEFDKLDKLVSNPNGFKILLLKLKEILQEAKELSAYFKKVATLEAEFATGLQKLQNPLMKDFDSKVGDLRSKFSKELTELSETVGVLVKDTERSRKQLKDALQKYSKEILDVDEKMTRAREKYEGSILEWEKFNEQGGNTMSKFGMFRQKIAMDLKMLPRSLEEAKQKSNHYNSLYTSLLHTSTSLHATYLQIHLPRVTTALLDAFENARSVMGRCLERFGKAKEEQVMGEAVVVSPLEGVGIRGVKLEEVDWSGLETSVPSLPLKSGSRNSLSLGRRNSVSLAPRSSLSLNPFGISRNSSTIIVPTSSQFGKSLDEITDLTSDQVPTLVQNCIDYIQSTGLYQEGIYRVSGNSNQISTLKQALDINPGLALEEVVKDVNSVTGVLKLFFREMKDTLIPRDLFLDFVNAAKLENEKVGLVKIHELVNSLNDLNYGTLKVLAKHLSIVSQNEVKNKMSIANLGIVWGPNIMDSGRVDANEMHFSAKVVEVIVANVDNLFEFD